MDFFRRLAQQLREVWAGMSMAGRIALVVVGALSLALIIGVGYWASQSEYRPLYTNLTPDDAQSIRSRLDAQGVPYRTSSDGSTISVPSDRVGALRVDLAAQGL